MPLNESHIEDNLIELLVKQGYEYFYGPDIAPYSSNPQREAFDSVLLENHLRDSIKRLNPDVPEVSRGEVFNHVLRLGSNDMMTNNEKFHTMLTDGVTVEHFHGGETKGLNVKLIDIEDISKNTFWAVNQLVVKENNTEKRFDVVLYINGLPLVVIELKNATDEKATLDRAYTQIQNYKKAVPTIFNYNSICVISDGLDAKVSSLSAPFSRYLSWKSPDKKENGILPELQVMAERMFLPEVLLKLIRFNTVFETEEVKDQKTGILSLVKIKKVAAYHQYYAVEKAVEQTLRATHSTDGDRKVGVVWHTQGSGKSLSMVFYT